ncbi:MAG: histidine kinase dimerization/phosphoacceptor domain -containing protein [Synechocystis sp.]|nr:histidine kinase dimerization/phosphoacceptor domain -containing protein [Synechocystis sp.]
MTDEIIKDLRLTLANMELALATVDEAIVWTDCQGRILWCNAVFDQLVDRLHILVLGQSLPSLLPLQEGDFSQAIAVHPYEQAIQSQINGQGLYGYDHGDRPILLEINWSCLRSPATDSSSATVRGCVLTIRDVTERQRREQELRQSKALLERQLADLQQAQAEILRIEQVNEELRLLETVLDVVLAGYWDWDIAKDHEYMSPGLKKMLGYQEHELPHTPTAWKNLIEPEDLPKVKASFLAHIQSQGRIPFYAEVRCRHRDGSIIWVICSGKVIAWDHHHQPLRVIGCHLDISQQKQAEAKLATSLGEKETLLKEIHHRVKNNLLVVSSLLSWQGEEIQDTHLLQALEDSQQRINSMALIHEKLYGSQDLARINFGEYLNSLIQQIFAAMVSQTTNLHLTTDLDAVWLNIETASPCGLIVNELVTNAIEHAFPDRRSGQLRVSFKQAPDQGLVLTIADDGIGLPPDLDIQQTTSLGWQLIHLLTDQLDGDLRVESKLGTHVEITFKELDYQKRF